MQQAKMAAEPVRFELFDPTGGVEVSQLFAGRLPSLDGKTIVELHNDMWESTRTFPVVRQALQKRFPTLKIIPFTEMPLFDERSSPAQLAALVAAVKARKAEGVILGNAG